MGQQKGSKHMKINHYIYTKWHQNSNLARKQAKMAKNTSYTWNGKIASEKIYVKIGKIEICKN